MKQFSPSAAAQVAPDNRQLGITSTPVNPHLSLKKRTLSFVRKLNGRCTSFLRRSVVLGITLLFGFAVRIRIVRFVASHLVNIQSVFICYPANEKYSKHFCFDFYLKTVKTRPLLIGFFFQGGKLGLSFATSLTEAEFTRNQDQLNHLITYVKNLKAQLNAERVSFSGILPSFLRSKGMAFDGLNDVTADVSVVLKRTEEQIRKLENLPRDARLVVVGARGSIGAQFVEMMKADGRDVVSIDMHNATEEWLASSLPTVLVDVSRQGALKGYLDRIAPNTVVINETYPEPDRKTREVLKKRGCRLYHISGAVANAYPQFPLAYAGGIPCCAIHNFEKAEIKISRLV